MLPKLPLAMEDISLMLWASVAADTSVPEGETAEVTREIIEFATVEQFCENRSTVYSLFRSTSIRCTRTSILFCSQCSVLNV